MNKKLFIAGSAICMGAVGAAYFFYSNAWSKPDTTKVVNPGIFDKNGQLNGNLPVFLEFWATWCGPCRAEAPLVEAASKELQGKVKFVKIDIDRDPQGLHNAFQVDAIPTMVILKPHSKVAFIHTGYINQAQLHRFIDTALKSTKTK